MTLAAGVFLALPGLFVLGVVGIVLRGVAGTRFP